MKMQKKLEELRTELKALREASKQLTDRDAKLTDAEREELKKIGAKAESVAGEIKTIEADMALDAKVASIGRQLGITEGPAIEQKAPQYRDPVEAFLRSEQWAEVRDAARGGQSFKTQEVEYEYKAPSDPTATNPDVDHVQHLRPGIVGPVVYPQRVGALFSQSPMDGGSITHLKFDGDAGAALTDYPGAAPDEGTATLDSETTIARTIAAKYLCPIEALDDVSALEGTLRNLLLVGPTGLSVRAEHQYINGTGAGTPKQLRGILSLNPSVYTGEDRVSKNIFAAALEIEEEVGSPATALALNPRDFRVLAFEEGADERPLGSAFGGPYSPIQLGMSIVRTKAVAQGTGIVGAWDQSTLYTRRSASIQATSEGMGLLDAGLVLFVARMRVALVHFRGASAYRRVAFAE